MKISAIIPAAGSGSRYDKEKSKLLEDLQGAPVIIRTLNTICDVEEIDEIIICTSKELIESISSLIKEAGLSKAKKVILGGKTRQESVFKGLKELAEKPPELALIHDGARPLISKEIIKKTIKTAQEKGASITAVPAKDTIKRVNTSTGKIIETLDRQELWNVQTPQVFKFKDILQVHKEFQGQNFTDDAALMEKAGYKVFITNGNYQNIKITTKEDIKLAEIL